MHDLILGKTYENTDLDLNTVESSRRLMERHFNAINKNSYEQIHIQSSAEHMCTYDELFAIPINYTESISITTDEEVCFVLTFDSKFFFFSKIIRTLFIFELFLLYLSVHFIFSIVLSMKINKYQSFRNFKLTLYKTSTIFR